MRIASVSAREILDSRGNPTVEAKIILENGIEARAHVPSGASTGIHEAWELRDGGKRYGGKGVQKAIAGIEKHIKPALIGTDIFRQEHIDTVMRGLDDTPNKSRLGANAILAVSLAVARAGALAAGKPLYRYLRELFKSEETTFKMPIPTMNVLNGGRHANNGLSVQEFMIIPKHPKLRERVRMGVEIFHALKHIIDRKGLSTGVGDEGGFSPKLPSNEDALKLLTQAAKAAGYRPGGNVFLGVDVAASEFFVRGKYRFEGKKAITASELSRIYGTWIKRYPLISIEDPLAEDAWADWANFTKEFGRKIRIVGDDLFVTNAARLQRGIDQKVANTILIKLNQIGTLTETLDTIRLAKNNRYSISVSHRSGETVDTFIADLAVAVNADFIKTGSLSRSERVEKYNRLMEIEAELEAQG